MEIVSQLFQRRIDQQRNGFLPCFKHNLKERKEKSEKEKSETEKDSDESDNSNSFTGKMFKKFGQILVNPIVTVNIKILIKTRETL